jgi:hypothetical protein
MGRRRPAEIRYPLMGSRARRPRIAYPNVDTWFVLPIPSSYDRFDIWTPSYVAASRVSPDMGRFRVQRLLRSLQDRGDRHGVRFRRDGRSSGGSHIRAAGQSATGRPSPSPPTGVASPTGRPPFFDSGHGRHRARRGRGRDRPLGRGPGQPVEQLAVLVVALLRRPGPAGLSRLAVRLPVHRALGLSQGSGGGDYVADLVGAAAALRSNGASKVALMGASLGGNVSWPRRPPSALASRPC